MSNDLYDPNNVDMHLPDENFIDAEPTTKSLPLMPIILFGAILLLIGILGALLWWGSTFFTLPTVASPEPVATRPTAEQNNEPESANAEANVQVLDTLSTSNELPAIKADLFGTTIEGIDSEITAIDQALGL